ncbi:hypothetical protein D3C75_136000 [compost metagenome]
MFPTKDSWDWPFLLYIVTTVLKKSERQFWLMTPRKLNALTRAHARVNGDDKDKPKKMGYIDQVM